MKKFKIYLVALTILTLLTFSMRTTSSQNIRGSEFSPLTTSGPAAQTSRKPQAKFNKVAKPIPNNYIVVLNDDAVSRTANADVRRSQVSTIADNLAQSHGGRVGFIYESALAGFSIELPNEASAIALSRNPQVKYVEEDALGSVADTQFNPPWGLDRIDQISLPLNSQYVFNATGAGVSAYIIDTGIRATHVDFGGRASIAANFVGSEFCDAPGNNDCNSVGHGTHVAGTVGGTTFGVAKGVTIRSIKVCNSFGSCQVSATVAGINFATTEHNNTGNRAVANVSLGFPPTLSLDDAVQGSINAGVTYAISAGNSNLDLDDNPVSPARVAAALTVGASDINDFRATFSNFGTILDIFAPGVDVLSASNASNTGTRFLSGTSMASPHTAGAVALYLQGRTAMTNCAAHPKQGPSATDGSTISTCPDRVNQFIVSNASWNQLSSIPSDTKNRLLFTASLPTTTNPMDNNQFFVWQQYPDFLNREPDFVGFFNWLAVLNSCSPSDWPCLNAQRIHTVRGFIESGEFKADKPELLNPSSIEEFNAGYVTWLYRSLLRREPDAGGFATWVNHLNSTGDYSHAVHGFINSHEYRRRFGPHP